MTRSDKHTGFAIAIAWPQTYCKQPGSWYEGITTFLGANKNNYYKVGHAALVLINSDTKTCHYFDFGRYHTPFQYGRVRSELTDCELKMNTKPILSGDGKNIVNFSEILTELQNNSACHGEGEIYASYTSINFISSFNKATVMQQNSPLPYGPFKYKGSNCSRFVSSVILNGKISLKQKFSLKLLTPFTATPLSNVNSLHNKQSIPKFLNTVPFYPTVKLPKQQLNSTLIEPVRPENIPTNAQWLSGEGVGSWFVFAFKGKRLNITRYSPSGAFECSGIYSNQIDDIIIGSENLKITYPSNCQIVTLLYGNKVIAFEAIKHEHNNIRRQVSSI